MSSYRLSGRLETGELAELYEGLRDERDRVVIKLFHPRTSDQRYARVMADVSARLSTVPGDTIIQPIDMGMWSGRLALVREHVDGHTLGQALQRLATKEVLITPSLALYLVIGLLDGAQRAHDAGTVHGAITPGNVLLGRDGRVALADFGALAALAAVPELRAFTQRGRGTYRAPETNQGAAPDALADVYSLGAIAYELLTLREPSRGAKAVSTRNEALPPPSRLDRRINARLDPIIMRALEQHPGRRFRSCQDMAQALRNFLSASGGMPGRGDVAKWVGDLFPPNSIAAVAPEVPVTQPFSLAAVEGAALTVAAGAETPAPSLIEPRPSFSHGDLAALLPEQIASAETLDEVPAANDENSVSAVLPWDAPPGEAPVKRRAAAASVAPPDDGAPAPVTSWDAPPGEAPVKRKPVGTGASVAARPASMRGRVRVMEEFLPSDTVDEANAEPEVSSTRLRGRSAAASSGSSGPSGSSAPELAAAAVAPSSAEAKPRAHAAPPAKAAAEPSPLLRRTRRRQRHFLAIAGAVALVGVFLFALMVWRFGTGASGGSAPGQVGSLEGAPPEEGTAAVDRSAAPGPVPAPVRGPVPMPVPTGPEVEDQRAAEAAAAAQAAKAQAQPAFLTLTSNVRAKVYVNGKALRGHTPVRKRKIEPGTHTIAVVAVSSGERREFTKRFEPGQTVTVSERFTRKRRR